MKCLWTVQWAPLAAQFGEPICIHFSNLLKAIGLQKNTVSLVISCLSHLTRRAGISATISFCWTNRKKLLELKATSALSLRGKKSWVVKFVQFPQVLHQSVNRQIVVTLSREIKQLYIWHKKIQTKQKLTTVKSPAPVLVAEVVQIYRVILPGVPRSDSGSNM